MKQISNRCGKSYCVLYDKHDKVSGCFLYDDRKQCSKSLKQRMKATVKSRKREKERLL